MRPHPVLRTCPFSPRYHLAADDAAIHSSAPAYCPVAAAVAVAVVATDQLYHLACDSCEHRRNEGLGFCFPSAWWHIIRPSGVAVAATVAGAAAASGPPAVAPAAMAVVTAAFGGAAPAAAAHPLPAAAAAANATFCCCHFCSTFCCCHCCSAPFRSVFSLPSSGSVSSPMFFFPSCFCSSRSLLVSFFSSTRSPLSWLVQSFRSSPKLLGHLLLL